MAKKACPDCVISAGAELVRARHICKGKAEAKKAKGSFNRPNFENLSRFIYAAILHLETEYKVLGMEFGPGLLHLAHARKAKAADERYAHLLCAHLAFKTILDKNGIENPTNQQIAGKIALANWR